MALLDPSVARKLQEPQVQTLLAGSLVLGALSSVLGYWVWNEVKGEPRMDTTRAIMKGTAVSAAGLLAVALYENWKIQKVYA
jgi:hypothetical protein